MNQNHDPQTPANDEVATLTLRGKSYDFPVLAGTEANEVAIDISSLRKRTGAITMDNGLGNTGACESKITYLDGDRGILRYRGYPIEELAEHARFIEVAYLIVYGELPTPRQLEEFSTLLNRSSLMHEDMRHFFLAFPNHAHPMGVLATMVASMSTFYPLPEKLDQPSEHWVIANLISTVRTIAAFSYKKIIGEPPIYPSHRLKFTENFLNMMFSSPVQDYVIDKDVVRAIDLFLILHADHEQNCSAAAVRVAGSSNANVYAVISAGISALWGPRHGGANQEVIAMLDDIHGSGKSVNDYVEGAKAKKFRLMGFGHRVYKTFDPRAKILKEYAHKLLNRPGMNDPRFDIARRLEEIVLQDDYFLSRNLYPNVDFYSGLILKACGIPYDMFTVLFAIGRTPGWLAQWREMRHYDNYRIYRPRQLYIGDAERSFVPLGERVENK